MLQLVVFLITVLVECCRLIEIQKPKEIRGDVGVWILVNNDSFSVG